MILDNDRLAGIDQFLQFNQRIAGIGSERLEGFRPLADNFIGFLLAVRPDSI